MLLPRLSYVPGEKIHGKVEVRTSKELRHRGLHIKLRCVETLKVESGRSRHVENVEKYVKTLDLLGEGVLSPGSHKFEFSFPIPPDAPPSYSGRGVQIKWTLKAWLDLPMRPDLRDTVEFQVFSLAGRQPQGIFESVKKGGVILKIRVDRDIVDPRGRITGEVVLEGGVPGARALRLDLFKMEEIQIRETLGISRDRNSTRVFSTILSRTVAPGSYNFELRVPRGFGIFYNDEYTTVWSTVRAVLDLPFRPDIWVEVPVTVAITPRQEPKPVEVLPRVERGVPRAAELRRPDVEYAVIELMKDGAVRDVVDIKLGLGGGYSLEEVKEACRKLVERGVLEVIEPGVLLEKYRIRRKGGGGR